MAEMSDFQKQFMSRGTNATLFTQKEFDDALVLAKAEIMAMAIEASKMAVVMEREACGKLADELGPVEGVGDAIRNRLPKPIPN
jgi:hypothetical protein